MNADASLAFVHMDIAKNYGADDDQEKQDR